ncbi:MAG: hypothetical protein JXM71_04375, partial [Spirochaetales bacterium]|nr:hypothetical protein [Spirochaetales bacterium]
LGKTNMSEWANFRSRYSSSGWSSEGGQSRNPYALDRSPSGSSSGSAVAVAAGLCPMAVGTETDGSIVSPASVNGVVGIKPEAGRLSQAGIVPISSTQDTAGPLASSVHDAVLLLDAMSGLGGWAGRSSAAPLARLVPSAGSPELASLRGLRLGYAARLGGFHPGTDMLMAASLDILRGLGAVIVETDLAGNDELDKAEHTVMLYEFRHELNRYLAREAAADSTPEPRSLVELIAYNREHADTTMPYFGQDILEEAAQATIDDATYRAALASCHRLARVEGLDRQMEAYRLDALLAPSGAPAWKIDHVNGDHYMGGSAGYPAVAGYPNLSVPAGLVSGLPVGLSIMGLPTSWPAILRVGAAFEAARPPLPPPLFLTSLD